MQMYEMDLVQGQGGRGGKEQQRASPNRAIGSCVAPMGDGRVGRIVAGQRAY